MLGQFSANRWLLILSKTVHLQYEQLLQRSIIALKSSKGIYKPPSEFQNGKATRNNYRANLPGFMILFGSKMLFKSFNVMAAWASLLSCSLDQIP